MLGETLQYIRTGFDANGTRPTDAKPVFNFGDAVSDPMCIQDAIAHGLLTADQTLTAGGMQLYNLLQSKEGRAGEEFIRQVSKIVEAARNELTTTNR